MDERYQDYIESGLIQPEDLQQIISQSDVKILDASFVLPTSPESPQMNFIKERIGGAAFFDINLICDQNSHLPHMLPGSHGFEEAVSTLGISNDDLVVIYGQSGIAMGPARAWWMFRVFGHDNVCVLNGGLPAWKRLGFPVDTAPPSHITAVDFVAEYHLDLVSELKTVRKAVDERDRTVKILDARPEERFTGEKQEPRAELRSGHMPGSVNIPCMSLIDQETGMLKTKDELLDILSFYMDDDIITTCGSGVTACVIALAFYNLGLKNVPVYDGSWSEYGQSSLATTVH